MRANEALLRLEELRPRTEQNRRLRVVFLDTKARLEAMRGHFDLARDLIAQAETLARAEGPQTLLDLRAGPAAGYVELVAGDAAAAERWLRPACEGMERIGELGFLSSVAPMLVDAVLEQRRDDEALELTERWHVDRLTAPEDLDAQVAWRRVRAKAVARRGEIEEAERLSREAMALVSGSDFLDAHADVTRDLAEVLRLADRPEESMAALDEAIRLYEAKGNIAAAATARASSTKARITL